MSASELGRGVEADLLALADAPHLAVLLGAGASVGAGLPDWDRLALNLLRTAGAIPDDETARAYLARQDPTLAAEAARASSSDWDAALRSAFYGGVEEALVPTVLHLATAVVAARRPVGEVDLLTLNLDLLLEEALFAAIEDVGVDRGVFSRALATPRSPANAHEVHHLHGLLPREDNSPPSGVVLTLSDFNDLGRNPHAWQVAALQEAVTKGPLVLAGTSYRDADVRQWLHNIGPATGEGESQVVVLLAREGLGLSREQFASVTGAITQQWAAIGVRVVLLHDHSDAAQLLWELHHVNEGGYRLPAERTAQLWQRHLDEFTTLQRTHSERLDEDLQALSASLPVETNLTLWLADGTGLLRRWSSHDRVYRHPDKLRGVPLGHDSAWATGQAVGRNEVVRRELSRSAADTGRWSSVVAAPVIAELAGGPALPIGALSSATSGRLEPAVADEWSFSVTDLAQEWGDRLSGD